MIKKIQGSLKLVVAGVVFCLMVAWMSGSAAATDGGGKRPVSPDNSLYAGLLAAHVRNGVVDYAGFKAGERQLDQYLKILENTDIPHLNQHGQMACYINLYNAWTIKLVLSEYPEVKSIKELGGFLSGPWKKKLVRLKGDVFTLDYIEHDILRPVFKDPRIHFAVNCASKGCPALLSEPYDGDRLEDQLSHVTRSFINDPQRNYLEGNTLYVSSIFKWFSEDFNGDVAGFVMRYADGPLKQSLEQNRSRIKIKYLDYDWSLNGR